MIPGEELMKSEVICIAVAADKNSTPEESETWIPKNDNIWRCKCQTCHLQELSSHLTPIMCVLLLKLYKSLQSLVNIKLSCFYFYLFFSNTSEI